jgi:hypothetical protein
MLKTSLRGHAWTAVSVLSLFGSLAGNTSVGQELTSPKADHHAHLFSPVAGQVLQRALATNAKKQDSTVKQGPIIKQRRI